MAVAESGKRSSDEAGKKSVVLRPTMGVGQHGHCNDGVSGKCCIAMHRRKIHGTQFAMLYTLVPVMLEVAKEMNVT